MTEPDDFDLFRAETKGIKPIKQDTFVAPRQKSGQKKSHLRDIREKEDTLFYFSDEYEPLLNEHDGVIKYLREGEDSHLTVLIFTTGKAMTMRGMKAFN